MIRRRQRGSRNATSLRVLQPRTARISADPSSTNLIVKRPFSYKVEVGTLYNSTSLQSSYASVFPEYNAAMIKGCRIDRVAVWGSDALEATEVYLSVGQFFSRRDTNGKNHRSRICCIPKLEQGQSDETTLIAYEGGALLHIEGVVYLQRETLPGSPPQGSSSPMTSFPQLVSQCNPIARQSLRHQSDVGSVLGKEQGRGFT